MNKYLILSWFLFTSSIFVNGQEISWSLQKCISVALENNIDIKIKQLQVLKAQKTYTHPLLELFPTIGLVGNHTYNFGSTIDPNTNNRVSSDIQYDNLNLNANLNLLDFRNLAEASKNKVEIELAKADKEVIEYEYKLQLLEKYFDALFSQELVKIQKEQLKNSVFNRDRIAKEVEIGKKPKSDLYDILLSFSQDEKRLLEAEQEFYNQKLQLFQLMNYQVKNLDNIELEIYLAEEMIENEDFQNPKIQLAELAFKSKKKDISILKSANLPSLIGFYGFSTFYSSPINQPNNVPSFQTQFDDNKNHQAGLQLNIPVFTGFKRSRQILASKIESEKMKLVSEQEKIKIQQQIDLENVRKNQYIQLTESLQNTLKYAKESFKTTQSKFTSGIVDAVNYTAVKNQLLTSEYDFLRNNLMTQLVSLKINLIEKNNF